MLCSSNTVFETDGKRRNTIPTRLGINHSRRFTSKDLDVTP
jgi:hypothetical protein